MKNIFSFMKILEKLLKILRKIFEIQREKFWISIFMNILEKLRGHSKSKILYAVKVARETKCGKN